MKNDEQDDLELEREDEQEEQQPDDKPAAKAGDKGKGKGGDEEETVTLSKRELAAMRRELEESKQSERYWSEQARGGKQQPVEEEEEEDEDDPAQDNDTLVDEFSTKGIEALVKRGVITKKAAVQMIEKHATRIARKIVSAERQKATTDHAIMSEFPDLKNQESELFKLTREELRKIVALDPSAAKSPGALYSAASIAKTKLEVKAASTRRRPARDEEDDRYEYDGDEEEEADRRLRAASQGGNRSRRGRAAVEDDDYMPPQTRKVMEMMYPDESDESRVKMFRSGKRAA